MKEAASTLATVIDDIITLPLPDGGRLTLKLVDTPSSPASDALPTLLAAYLRLRLLALYRHRRSNVHPFSHATATPVVKPSPTPTLLTPALNLVTLYLRTSRILSVFTSLVARLPSNDASVTQTAAPLDLASDLSTAGGTITLHLPASRRVHARLTSTLHAVSLDLADGRRVTPSTSTQICLAVEAEVKAAYALGLRERLGEGWKCEAARGRCEGSKGCVRLMLSCRGM